MIEKPAGPRIRTKIDRLDPGIDTAFFEITERLRSGEIDIVRFQAEALRFFQESIAQGKFAELAAEAMAADGQVFAMRRNVDDCRYSIVLYRVDKGEVVPPHCHHNVASTQILLDGELHLREYDRVGWDESGQLLMRLVSERTLKPGDWFQASEWRNNVHWFEALGGPALIFNMNARGYEDTTFEPEAEKFGRLYVDPTRDFRVDGTIRCERFDEATAMARFSRKPMRDFQVPPTHDARSA